MKITCLTENTSSHPELTAEHGLSLYIETEKHNILFDMGQTDAFAKNANVLGIDLACVDIAVLSHGHYDHGGGLSKFSELNKTAPVYINRNAFEPHYNGTEKYIGLDPALSSSDRIIFTDDEFAIDSGITLYTKNASPLENSLGSFGLTMKTENNFVPDDFRHEQYLLIEESDKRVLIVGCSHKGIVDIVNWFSPDVLVGGFHLSKLAIGNTLDDIAKKLNAHKTAYYTCHCTGTVQYEYMTARMERLHYISCGGKIVI